MLFLLFSFCLANNGFNVVNSIENTNDYQDLIPNDTTIKNLNSIKMPTFFDARIKWAESCPSVGNVVNQGKCRSGWAISIINTITDRRCIQSLGLWELPLSPMMLLSCCPNCGGCSGGSIVNAWKFVRDKGLVTGSLNANTRYLKHNDGCQPFRIKPLRKNDLLKSSTQCSLTPVCVKTKCTNPNYTLNGFKPTNFKIDNFKLFSSKYPEDIMRELIKNGPIQVSFHLYEDFRYYKADENNNCSIYIHTWGKREGEHASKLIGWGTEHDVKYWLLINSFGKDWGCNGTFKVLRNSDGDMNFGYAIIAPSFYGFNNYGSMSTISMTLFKWTLLIYFIIN